MGLYDLPLRVRIETARALILVSAGSAGLPLSSDLFISTAHRRILH